MYIQRDISKKLEGLARQFPCIILTGARQTGKTTLLKHLYPKYSFVSLDLPSTAELAEKKPHEFFNTYPSPVIIDEIQYAPQVFRYLKVKIDESRSKKGQFLLTGSQKFTLMQNVSESLAGRCALLELDTLSAQEFSSLKKPKPQEWIHFLFRGGFPELVVENDLPSADFYHAYLSTYIERDVRSLIQVGNLRDFERLIRMCAVRSAQLLNVSELARDVGVSPPTAKQWLSVLEASNQIGFLEPYFGNRTKRMIKTPKIYFRDTGLLCYLLGISTLDQLLGHPQIGSIWETFIYGQIRRDLARSSTAASLWFYRDAQGMEVDFVIDSGGYLNLFETKWGEYFQINEVQNLQKVLTWFGTRKVKRTAVLCRTPENYPLTENIRVENGFEIKDYLG